MTQEGASLVALPPMGEGEMVLIETLLRGAGYWLLKEDHCASEAPSPTRLFVRATEIDAIREFLKDYRVRYPGGTTGPIPW